MTNPFTLRVIPHDSPFCDRESELRDLLSHAKNKANVVLFSPRRYGKTSLMKRLQADLTAKGFFTVYADFFMATSENEIARRIAKSIYTPLHERESFLDKGVRFLKIFKAFRPVFKPSPESGFSFSVEPVETGLSGIELIDKVMTELGLFIRREAINVHIVFDEFQEITQLKNSSIEGVLRRHIQEHQASYFFVGSRRRTLLDIFNQKKRPFYQSAIIYPLDPLPHEELVAFLIKEFKKTGKECSKDIAEKISNKIFHYPYYAQSLAYHVYEISGEIIKEQDIEAGFQNLIASERYGYEAIIQGITGPQISLLRAIANDPASKILTTGYLQRHKLSVGGVQYAKNKLEKLDLIEKHNNCWRIVDPVFGKWLSMF